MINNILFHLSFYFKFLYVTNNRISHFISKLVQILMLLVYLFPFMKDSKVTWINGTEMSNLRSFLIDLRIKKLLDFKKLIQIKSRENDLFIDYSSWISNKYYGHQWPWQDWEENLIFMSNSKELTKSRADSYYHYIVSWNISIKNIINYHTT